MRSYITQAGDRWDLVSTSHYGTPFYADVLQEANPDVPLTPLLPAGLELVIPDVEEPVTEISVTPPWKREGWTT